MNWKGKLILCTGGAGFLGGSLAEDLIRQGAEVDIIDNFSVGTHESVPEGVTNTYDGDVCEKELDRIDVSYDMVFHFAAPCTILLFDKEPLKMYANAIEAAYSIRKFCTDTEVPYMIYASSATYYGKTTYQWNKQLKGHLIHQENMPPRPANIYGCTKCAEENFDTLFPEVKYLGLRYFPVYGSREWLKGGIDSVPYKFAKNIIAGEQPEIWGRGDQSRDYIYIDDAIYCTRTLAERDTTGYYNIGTGKLTYMDEFVPHINKILGTNIRPKYIPNPYEGSYLKSLKSDPSKLLKVIGKYEFIGIREGLELMIEEMISNGDTA